MTPMSRHSVLNHSGPGESCRDVRPAALRRGTESRLSIAGTWLHADVPARTAGLAGESAAPLLAGAGGASISRDAQRQSALIDKRAAGRMVPAMDMSGVACRPTKRGASLGACGTRRCLEAAAAEVTWAGSIPQVAAAGVYPAPSIQSPIVWLLQAAGRFAPKSAVIDVEDVPVSSQQTAPATRLTNPWPAAFSRSLCKRSARSAFIVPASSLPGDAHAVLPVPACVSTASASASASFHRKGN